MLRGHCPLLTTRIRAGGGTAVREVLGTRNEPLAGSRPGVKGPRVVLSAADARGGCEEPRQDVFITPASKKPIKVSSRESASNAHPGWELEDHQAGGPCPGGSGGSNRGAGGRRSPAGKREEGRHTPSPAEASEEAAGLAVGGAEINKSDLT